jgi:RNA polymerase sigma factor (sigma-70 family)
MTTNNTDTAISLYLREIGRTPLLTPQEEIDLARKIQSGDREARELMIRSNLRLVVTIARDYANFGLPLLDLISEGNIGLMKAVERFDLSKRAKLSTYAVWWIRQSREENHCPAFWFWRGRAENASGNRQEIGRFTRENPPIGEYRDCETAPGAEPKRTHHSASRRRLKSTDHGQDLCRSQMGRRPRAQILALTSPLECTDPRHSRSLLLLKRW